MKRIGVLTSGGDSSGMNSAIRGVVRTALHMGAEVYGIRQGYKGLLEEEIFKMKSRMAGGIIHHGGTIIKTARCLEFKEKENQEKAVSILKKYGIEGLVVIGGDGSLKGAEALSALGVPTVTVPGTIDNDMPGTDETIGFDTAVNTVREATNKIRDTAASHDRAALIEVMGRHAGHIALAAGLACGAEYILVPEIPFEKEKLAKSLMKQMECGRTNNIIICAEGAADARVLGAWLKEKTKIDICITILGYIQRGGAPSARDAMLGSILGSLAAEALIKGEHINCVAGTKNGQAILVPYDKAEQVRRVFSKELYNLAAILGTAAVEEPII